MDDRQREAPHAAGWSHIANYIAVYNACKLINFSEVDPIINNYILSQVFLLSVVLRLRNLQGNYQDLKLKVLVAFFFVSTMDTIISHLSPKSIDYCGLWILLSFHVIDKMSKYCSNTHLDDYSIRGEYVIAKWTTFWQDAIIAISTITLRMPEDSEALFTYDIMPAMAGAIYNNLSHDHIQNPAQAISSAFGYFFGGFLLEMFTVGMGVHSLSMVAIALTAVCGFLANSTLAELGQFIQQGFQEILEPPAP